MTSRSVFKPFNFIQLFCIFEVLLAHIKEILQVLLHVFHTCSTRVPYVGNFVDHFLQTSARRGETLLLWENEKYVKFYDTCSKRCQDVSITC